MPGRSKHTPGVRSLPAPRLAAAGTALLAFLLLPLLQSLHLHGAHGTCPHCQTSRHHHADDSLTLPCGQTAPAAQPAEHREKHAPQHCPLCRLFLCFSKNVPLTPTLAAVPLPSVLPALEPAGQQPDDSCFPVLRRSRAPPAATVPLPYGPGPLAVATRT